MLGLDPDGPVRGLARGREPVEEAPTEESSTRATAATSRWPGSSVVRGDSTMEVFVAGDGVVTSKAATSSGMRRTREATCSRSAGATAGRAGRIPNGEPA